MAEPVFGIHAWVCPRSDHPRTVTPLGSAAAQDQDLVGRTFLSKALVSFWSEDRHVSGQLWARGRTLCHSGSLRYATAFLFWNTGV